MKTCLAVSKNFPLVKQLFPKSTNLLENLLALETKLLLQIYLTQVALILTQVDSNPTQVEWNLKCICWKNDQKWNSRNLAIFGYRRCKQSRIYTVIFKDSIWSGSGWMVSTLASHARGPGFKPRAGHAFLFLSYSQKSNKKWLPAM